MDILQTRYLFLRFLKVEAAGVVGVEFVDGDGFDVAFGEVFVVVEGAVVSGDAEEVAEVLSLGAFFLGEEGLVHLLAVADADDLDVFLFAAEEFADCLGLGLDGAGRGLLDEDVAVLAVLEGEKHKVDGLIQAHDETRHAGLGEGNGLAGADLVDPERDDTAARAHDVAIARAADLGAEGVAALRDGDLLLEGLADAHGIDGIGGLVGGKADDALDAGVDGRFKDVVSTDDVGLDGLHREKLAARDLFERGGMEDIVHTAHGAFERGLVAHVAYVELDLVRDLRIIGLVLMAHVVLFLLVARENADFLNIRREETLEDSVAEGTGSSGDHECSVFEDGHNIPLLLINHKCRTASSRS